MDEFDLLEQIGKTYPPVTFEVTRDEVIRYAYAIGDGDPLYINPEAAQAAGFADVVAPAMFAVVYCNEGLRRALFDPALKIDFAHLVHGAQEFQWPGPAVVAGDAITTTVHVADMRETAGLEFYVFGSESVNQDGAVVAEGLWTNIVRRPDGQSG